jgi:hypothetical protein
MVHLSQAGSSCDEYKIRNTRQVKNGKPLLQRFTGNFRPAARRTISSGRFQRIFTQLTALPQGSMLMRETNPSMNLSLSSLIHWALWTERARRAGSSSPSWCGLPRDCYNDSVIGKITTHKGVLLGALEGQGR